MEQDLANGWVPSIEDEDIHMAVEGRLHTHIGAVAGKLHTARSPAMIRLQPIRDYGFVLVWIFCPKS